jgi:hypothetical protein
MSTTRLEITNARLHAAVHYVWERLPAHVRAAMGPGRLVLVTDRPTNMPPLKMAMCATFGDGRREIFLTANLATQSEEEIAFAVAHEFAHVLQDPDMDTDRAEALADAMAEGWGFAPTARPVIDWKR